MIGQDGIDVKIHDPDHPALHRLVVQGNSSPACVDTGCWYYIDDNRDKMNLAQSGTWEGNVSGGTFTVTSASATTPKPAALTEWMVG
ncbi:MAG: hypothetical protein H6841_06635 [Planctomycetes bacterium]|nr:hypothetical protein [Planctomycetota bacterium]